MIPIKTKKEIEILKQGGEKLSWVLRQILKETKPQVALCQLDKLATELIKKQGGQPSFKMVPGYHWATCINVNDGVVHGIPGNYRLQKNDLVSVDIGMFYEGLHTDMARTIRLKEPKDRKEESDKFLAVGEKTLEKAIKVAKAGNRVGHISQVIEKELKKAGFSPVEVLTGHGVGKELHEDPMIPCFLSEEIKKTPLLKEGMVLAIEVIYTQGQPDLIIDDDQWTMRTADGKLAGLFEKTIAVGKKGSFVLTPF
jgi:methionyl aminopeptidase